jgi:hypothetical protein
MWLEKWKAYKNHDIENAHQNKQKTPTTRVFVQFFLICKKVGKYLKDKKIR